MVLGRKEYLVLANGRTSNFFRTGSCEFSMSEGYEGYKKKKVNKVRDDHVARFS